MNVLEKILEEIENIEKRICVRTSCLVCTGRCRCGVQN